MLNQSPTQYVVFGIERDDIGIRANAAFVYTDCNRGWIGYVRCSTFIAVCMSLLLISLIVPLCLWWGACGMWAWLEQEKLPKRHIPGVHQAKRSKVDGRRQQPCCLRSHHLVSYGPSA